MNLQYTTRLIILFILTVATLICIILVLSYKLQDNFTRAIDNDLQNIVHLVHYSTQKISTEKYPDKDSLQDFINTITKNPSVSEVSVINKERKVVASSNPKKVGRLHPLNNDFVIVKEELGYDKKSETHREYSVMIPVLRDNNVAGVVKTSFLFTNVDSMMKSIRNKNIVLAVVVFIIMGIVFSLMVKHMTRPIAQLCKAAERVSCGDMTVSVSSHNQDEIGTLITAFNNMIAQLQQQKALDERLNFIERRTILTETVAIMAHEVRNPLNMINLTAGHIEHQFAPLVGDRKEEFSNLVNGLKKQVQHLNAMVQHFLSVGKSLPLKKEQMRFESLVSAVLILINQQAFSKNISVVKEYNPDLLCCGDREQLELVLLNLLLNAIEFSPVNGHITLSAVSDTKQCTITVKDDGQGIKPEISECLFDPWVSTRESGMGLGLALCKRVINRHDGTIKAYNAPEGGAVFEFSIPSIGTDV
jgi:signal transduction histidine kinase